MPYRLYLVCVETGRKTGKKRDYPSKEHFIKYGVETYQRYNYNYTWGKKTKAELCYLNSENKWEKVRDVDLIPLLNK